jgi:hypothetical protein
MNSSIKFLQTILRVVLVSFIVLLSSDSNAQSTTFAKGSIIIDMGGAGAPTVANSLKPYGLIYDLLKNYNTPVSCVINSTKIKDGIDFVHNGKSYKGGPFIISAAYRSAAVNQAINNWRSQGVLIDSLVSDASLEVSYTLSFAPRWVMDATNGRLAVAYLTYAGIPASAYIFKDPSQLNSCDDIYAMPHAAPTWSTHNNLYLWNLNNKGAIWAGCSAASAMEALTGSLTINGVSTNVQMNFLTSSGLVLSSNHNKAVTPFAHLNPTQPMAQYIGTSDAAQTTGAETVYMPMLSGAWNPSVKLITSAPNQNDIPGTSPGPAGVNVFGRAFNDANRGYIAYQGGHSYSPSSGSPSAAQIAAQRMFFNFSFFAIKDKLQSALTVSVSGVPTQMVAGTTYTGLTATAVTSNGPVTYQWSASVPGTFSAPTSATTSFTPSNVSTATNCSISCVVTDACGRSTFDTKGGIVLMPNGASISAAAISQSTNCVTNTLSFDVFDYNTSITASTRSLTAVSGFSHGTATFTSAGVVSYTPSANFVGADNGTYTISNGVNTASSAITINVGSSALAPYAVNDVDTVIEDNVKVINVLANDKDNPTAANHNNTYVKDIVVKPTRGYVYINSDGTLSYLTNATVATDLLTDNFSYLVVNNLGYTSVASVTITLRKHSCVSSTQYQTSIDAPGGTQTWTFTPTADTYLSSSSSTTNYGTNSTFSLRYKYKPLLKFDLSSIPSSTTITGANLTLTYSSTYSGSSNNKSLPAYIYPLKRTWGENTATWDKYDGTNSWGTAGALSTSTDYNSTLSATTATITSTQNSGATLVTSITSIAQAWVTTPSSNYGLLIAPVSLSTSNSSSAYFYSRETSTNSYKPTLTVTATVAGTTYPCSTIPTNYKPVIYPITSSVNSNATVTISPTLSYNYYGRTNTLLSVTTPAHGTASISGSTIIYDPTDSYFGADTLTYTVKDPSTNVQNTATIFVTVNRVDPNIVWDAVTTNSGTAADVFVTTNDVDPYGSSLSAPVISTPPQNGTAVVSGTKIVYTPIAGFTGQDSFVYSRSSATSGCYLSLTDTAIVRVTVLNQNPIATNDDFTTALCTSHIIDLLANDSDPEGTILTVSYISNPSHGTLTQISDGVYKYTPSANFSGSDQFTYKVKDASDAQLESSLATVSIIVTPIASTNNTPLAINDNDNGMIGQPIVTDVMLNDSDPDGDTLDISISAVGLTHPSHGTITLLPNNQISYQPSNGYYGTDSYQYKINDRHESCTASGSLSAIATVTLNVSNIPVNVSGTVWSDPNASGASNGTIYTSGESGTNISNSLYAYLVDASNVIIDLAPVAIDGTYSLVNTPSSTNNLTILLSTTSYSLGTTLSTSSLPSSHVFTSASSLTFNTSTSDITGKLFGINQRPVATTSSLTQQPNPGASMSIAASNFTGTDEAPGSVSQVHFTSFPTNISSITIGATSYTSGTWPGAGVTVNTGTSVSITPSSGSVTSVISFKVIDNGGAESNSAGTLSVPLYVALSPGSIGGGSSSVCGTAIPAAFTSVSDAAGGRDNVLYQWESSTTSSSSGYANILGATDATYTPTASISATTYFRRRAYTSLDANVYSNVITVTYNATPSAPTGTNGSRAGTGTVALSAAPPTGSTVDWYANQTGGSALLSGNNNFTTPSISYTTNYYAESRNSTTGCLSASRTMVTATVTGVVNPGVITNNILYVCGQDIPGAFTSTTDATGTGAITYQWEYSTTSATSGFSNCTDDPSATANEYTPVNTISSTTYFRRKATDNSTSGYSNVITITYKTVPADPVASDVARTGAGTVGLSASAVSGVTFDWYSDATATTSVLLGSNNYTTPVISSTTPYYVSARSIANGCPSSNVVTVNAIINAALDGGIIGSSASICGSGAPSAFTSTVDASNGTGTISYQWQKSTTSSSAGFSDIASATNATYTSGSLSTTTWFRRAASTPNDATVYSNVIEITINPLPSISITPSAPSIITGNSISVTAAGANSYSWSTGASTASISVSPTSTTTYTVTGTDGNTCQGTATVTVTVNPLPSVGGTATAVASSICANSSATINLAGYTGTIVWQSSPDGTNWSDTTVTTAQLQTGSLVAGYRYYRAKVTNATAAPDYSNAVIILIDPASVGGTVTGGTNVCTGTNSTVISLSGQTGSVTKWQSSTDGTNWNDIVSTSSSYTVTNISSALQYRAIVTSGLCPAANSSSTNFTIDPASVGGSIAGSATVCTGTNSTTLTLSGYTGSITKWQSSTDGGTTWNDISNTTTSYTASNLTQTTQYRAVITSGACSAANSTSATVTVNVASVGGSIAGASAVCTGTNSTTLTLSGHTGSVTKWQSSTDGSTWSDIANTTTTLTATNLTVTTQYRAVVTSGVCSSANSASGTVTVNALPTFSGNALNLDGSNDYVQSTYSTALNITTNLTMELWIYPTKNSGTQNVISKSSSSQNVSYIFPRTDDGWNTFSAYFTFNGTGWTIVNTPYTSLNSWHHVAMTYDGSNVRIYMDGTLVKTQAASGSITTNTNPLYIGNQNGYPEFYGGSVDEVRIWNVVRSQAQIQANMNNELTGSESGLVAYYKFNEGTPAGNNTAITTTADSSPNALNGTLNGFAKTGSTSNFVASPVGAGSISGNSTVCVGSTLTLSNSTSGGTWTSSDATVATINASTGVVTGVAVGTATITYTITNVSGCTNSATKSITVNSVPTVSAITGTVSVCAGGATTTLSNATSGGVWSSSNTAIATVGSSTGIVTGVAGGTATITYTITNGSGCSAASTAAITVNSLTTLSANTGTASACIGSTSTLSNSTSGGTWSSSNSSVATVGSSTGVVTGVAAGTATITYSYINANSCVSTATTTFTVYSLPTVASITGNSAVCVGASTTLSSSTAGGVWSSSNTGIATVSSGGVVTGLAVGNATITYTVTNGNGCVNSVTANISITALPVLSAISGSTSVCVGSTITLTNSTAGGVWSSSNTSVATVSSSGVVTGVSAGTATITYSVTGANGCSPVTVTSVITVNPIPSLSSSLGGVNIVTTNLKVNLDAGNSASYSGTGSTWYDLSGNNLNGTISGATYSSTDGGYFDFNGIANFVRVGTVPNTGNSNNSVSFGVWVSPNTTSGNIVSMSNTNPQGSWNMPPIAAYTGKFDGKIWNANHLMSSAYTNNAWYYVVIVFDYATQTQTLYVNGQVVSSQSGISYASSGVDNYFYLGQANPGADNRGMFKGRISALHIYGDKALTLQEVQQNYNATAIRYNLPVITSAPSGLTTCSGATFTYTPTSVVSGTTYDWSRAAVTGISNPAATGTGGVSEVLVNTTSSPITVNYVYTSSANGCSSTQTVAVTVNPASVGGTASSNQVLCSGAQPTNITLSGSVGDVQWQVSTDNQNWTNIAGATSTTLTAVQIGTVTVSSYIRALVTVANCTSAYSNTITLSVDGQSSAGTIGSPFTSLGMARNVTSAGVYYFNLTGTTFSSYVDANGWVQVILDYGQTTADLAQITAMDHVTRGILSPAVLAKLTDANEIRMSSNTGTFDVTSNNATLLSRVVNNQSISYGVSDNAINSGWTGLNTVGAGLTTANCDNGFSFELHRMVFHGCGDSQSGFHWLPTQGYHALSWSYGAGSLSSSQTMELWVRATAVASGGSGTLSITGDNIVCTGNTLALTASASGGTWLTSNSAVATVSSTGVVTGVTAGTVTITYNKTSALGCLFTATKVITVNTLPTVNTISNMIVGGGATVSAINFSGSVGTSFTWTNSNTAIGIAASGSGNISSFTAVNNGATPIVATVVVTPANSSSCVGTSTSFTITVNPAAQVNPVPTQVITNGQSTNAINFTTTNTGGTTTYQWSNNNTSIGLAASGTGSIPAFVGVNNGTSPQYAQITVTPYYTSGGVTTAGTPIIVLITVNPTPQINPVPSQVLNNGENTNAINYTTVNTGGVTTYAWTNNTTSIGLAATGSGNIASFVGVNNGTAPVVAILTATPTFTNALLSTTGSPTMFTITVNPTAQVNAVSNQVISNGQNTTAVNFATNNTGGTTTYAWTNSNSSIGLAASGTGSIPSFVGVNTGTSPIVATITVTPTFANAGASNTGAPITFTITINPAAQVNAVANQVLSNGQNTAAVNFTTVNTGGTTTYAWTNDATSIGLATSGTGNIASFTAVNTGTTPVVATITVTPSYTNAGVTTAGTPITFTITVNPAAQVNQPANQVISNGQNTTAVTFTTVNTGGTTTYAWTNNTTSIGLAASGTGNIAAFTGVNTGTAPIVATITVTPTYTNAGISTVGTSKTFTITVNPTPQVNLPANQVVSNGQSTAAVNFATVNTGGTTTYAWTNNTTSIGLAASGTGNIAAFTAINTGTAPVVATITVTPTYSNAGLSTVGTPQVFTITVNPSGQVNQPANQVLNHGQTTTAVTFSTINTGGTTTYAWTNNTTSIGLAASGTGDIAAFTAINTGTAPVVATITVTPTYTNGGLTFAGVPKTFTITVNPIPTVNAVANQVVCNNSQLASVTFSGAVTGTVYNWTNNTTGIGLAASGTGNLPVFTAINTTTSPIIATITVTPTFTNGGVTATGLPKTFTITVNPTTAVSAGTLPSRICISDSLVQLNGSPVGGYWTGIGADGFNFIPFHTAIGSYTLTYNYVNTYGCSSSASIVAKVEPCLERDRTLANDAAVIYPIPSDGHITLKINSHLYDKIELRLYKANGQYLGVKTFSGLSYGKTFSLDLSYLPSGVYFAKLTNDIGINGGYKVIRFIVQH